MSPVYIFMTLGLKMCNFLILTYLRQLPFSNEVTHLEFWVLSRCLMSCVFFLHHVSTFVPPPPISFYFGFGGLV